MIVWDESKRRANLAKHGIDFVGCDEVFDFPVVTQEDRRRDYGEPRMNLLGWLDGRVVHLTYTERNETIRVISLREATKHEAHQYFQAVSG